MKLVIAEKPSVAMALASVLGARTRKDGYVEGNGYIVSWCVGHLVGLCDASEYDEKYKKWRYDDLPIVPECWKHKVLEGTKKQFGILKKLMRDSKVDEVICATDLEQREGRINRFKCLAIRQNVADKYGKADGITFKRDIWTEMFEAAKAEKQNDQSELVPFWCFGKNQSVKIERLVPMYPMSNDEVNYERLIKILSLYRLTLGQARQEELLEYLFKEFKDTSGLKKLFIDLSPFSKGKEG